MERGSPDERASIGEIVGKGLPAEEVAPAIERVLQAYLGTRRDGEAFIDTVRRRGVDAFKEAIYAPA